MPIGAARSSPNSWQAAEARGPPSCGAGTNSGSKEGKAQLMRHGKLGRRFSRDSGHRQAMFSNLAAALIRHEQIVTTLAKAKDLRRVMDKYVTLAKRGDRNSRRLA